MALLFNMPRTAASNNFIQKGPTCWFYAAKMLVTLHNLRGVADFDSKWKSLHEVRKVISELSADSQLGGDPSEDLTWLRGRLGASLSQHGALVNKIEWAAALPHGWFREHELAKHKCILKRDLNIDFDKAVREQKALEQARTHMNAATSMDRYDLLNVFMPGVFTQGSMPIADCKPTSIENKLRKTGPFYASGDVWSSRENRRVRQIGAVPGDRRVEVSMMAVDSAHAVVVVGVSGGNVQWS